MLVFFGNVVIFHWSANPAPRSTSGRLGVMPFSRARFPSVPFGADPSLPRTSWIAWMRPCRTRWRRSRVSAERCAPRYRCWERGGGGGGVEFGIRVGHCGLFGEEQPHRVVDDETANTGSRLRERARNLRPPPSGGEGEFRAPSKVAAELVKRRGSQTVRKGAGSHSIHVTQPTGPEAIAPSAVSGNKINPINGLCSVRAQSDAGLVAAGRGTAQVGESRDFGQLAERPTLKSCSLGSMDLGRVI